MTQPGRQLQAASSLAGSPSSTTIPTARARPAREFGGCRPSFAEQNRSAPKRRNPCLLSRQSALWRWQQACLRQRHRLLLVMVPAWLALAPPLTGFTALTGLDTGPLVVALLPLPTGGVRPCT